MKLKFFSILALSLLTVFTARADSELNIPATLDAAGTGLVLNGQGKRTKLVLKLYTASLYLKAKSDDAAAIIAADEPMAIRLDITSSTVTPARMEKATREGFDAATDGNPGALAERIEKFLEVLRQGIAEGDAVELTYIPGAGTMMSRNGATGATIEGLDFKSALFAIWLGKKPVQKKLKSALLGG